MKTMGRYSSTRYEIASAGPAVCLARRRAIRGLLARWPVVVALAGAPALVPGEAGAAVAEELPTASDVPGAPTQSQAVATAVSNGAFLPLTLAPVAPRAMGFGFGGYDSARGAAVMEAHAEVALVGPVSVRAGVAYSDGREQFRPSVAARLSLLRQDAHGIDGAVGIFYKAEGFTQAEGEIETVLSAARQLGATTLIANLAYGQDPEGNERDGELRAAALLRVGQTTRVGLDGRWRFDLGTDGARLRSGREPTLDVDAGPVVAVALGPVALSVHAGVSVVRRYGFDTAVPDALSTRLGVVALGGAGTAF